MNNLEQVEAKKPEDSKTSLLAETVAVGLHSLAQPLTKAQWSLEMLAMEAQSAGNQQEEVSEALVALERLTAELDFLRNVISPFRRNTRFELVSIKELLWKAVDEHEDVLRQEKIDVVLDTNSSQGVVCAPQYLADRICFSLADLLCFLVPVSVSASVSASEDSVDVDIAVKVSEETGRRVPKAHQAIFKVRAYVEVLGGKLEISGDSSLMRMSLPKAVAGS